jgi:hypothetical protein
MLFLHRKNRETFSGFCSVEVKQLLTIYTGETMKNITIQEWQKLTLQASNKAEKIKKMIIARARKTCKEAGLDPGLLGIHPHNAMCGLHYGKPWQDVNYSLVRKTLWLIEKSYIPGRIADDYAKKLYDKIKF